MREKKINDFFVHGKGQANMEVRSWHGLEMSEETDQWAKCFLTTRPIWQTCSFWATSTGPTIKAKKSTSNRQHVTKLAAFSVGLKNFLSYFVKIPPHSK